MDPDGERRAVDAVGTSPSVVGGLAEAATGPPGPASYVGGLAEAATGPPSPASVVGGLAEAATGPPGPASAKRLAPDSR